MQVDWKIGYRCPRRNAINWWGHPCSPSAYIPLPTLYVSTNVEIGIEIESETETETANATEARRCFPTLDHRELG